MLSLNAAFEAVLREAHALYECSRYGDAAILYERALTTSCGREEQRLRAKSRFGDCLRLTGRPTEALVLFAEVYLVAKNQADYYYQAYYAFCSQIDTLRTMLDDGLIETAANSAKRLELVNKGLQWLYDIGQERWRHWLLFLRADALRDGQQALDAAEEAYRLKRDDLHGPGYDLAVYARKVAECARLLGCAERGFQVLDEVQESHMVPLARQNVLMERVRLLRALRPPQLAEALDVARSVIELSDQIQSTRHGLLCHAELAACAIQANSLTEAADALGVVRDTAFRDETADRHFLLTETRATFRKCQALLAVQDHYLAKNLKQKLTDWLEELEQADSKP